MEGHLNQETSSKIEKRFTVVQPGLLDFLMRCEGILQVFDQSNETAFQVFADQSRLDLFYIFALSLALRFLGLRSRGQFGNLADVGAPWILGCELAKLITVVCAQ